MSNTELPPGWVTVRLEDIAEVRLGRQRSPKNHTGDQMRPYLRAANVDWNGLKLDDVKEMNFTDAEVETYRLLPGDIVLGEASGSPREVGKPALWNGQIEDCCFQNTLIRVRPGIGIEPRYLLLLLRYEALRGSFVKGARGVGIHHLGAAKLSSWPVPLPPLAEQERIVEALEDQISRLDAAVRDLGAAHRKVSAFRKAVLLSLVPERSPDSWEVTTVGEAGSIDLGRQRHPDWHNGPEMRPYLRVANVFEDRIDTTDVMEMDFTGVFERYKLEPGDVLLNEGQSPHLVGRPALYRGQPANVAFTNSLLRFRARPDVLPEWALMVFRRHLHARRFMREVRITTNIAHLSSKRLKTVEFPIPPLEEQKQLIQRCEELMTDADALERGLERGLGRAQSLRKALLNRAFAGALVVQDPKDEPASALVDRIRAERASSGKGARAIRARRPRKMAGTTKPEMAPAPSAVASSTPHTAIQQEFEL
ncbi:restriction endonuclease subunit S [Streptomyces sp. NPDC094031]|uniref:restriction endonuclease subunit S n=1 Tax=Streptomyces sp. NPDC094031 TaxID=3155307 RepID=UPI003328C2F2